MKSRLDPYLHFAGDCRAAMEFYRSVFGGTLELTTLGEAGLPPEAGNPEHVMHAMLAAGEHLTFMASDMSDVTTRGNVSMTISGDNADELAGWFEALAAGGSISEPLAAAPWGDTFGMIDDRFGIHWMFNIAGPRQ